MNSEKSYLYLVSDVNSYLLTKLLFIKFILILLAGYLFSKLCLPSSAYNFELLRQCPVTND